jgi:hypothetical protein
MVPVSPSRRSPRHHPPPPLEANTHAVDAVPLPATNSSGGPNAEADNFVKAFLSSLPEIGAGDDANFLSEGGTANKIDTDPPPARLLFTIDLPGGADDNEEGIVLPDAPRGSIFPGTVPTVQGKSEYKVRCGKFKRLGDGLQGIASRMTGTRGTFIFVTSRATPSSWHRDFVRCTAACSTCLGT